MKAQGSRRIEHSFFAYARPLEPTLKEALLTRTALHVATALFVCVMTSVTAARADTIYLSEAAFTALPGLVMESFESLPASVAQPSLDAGPFSVAGGSSTVRIRTAPFNDMAATDGTHYLSWLTGGPATLVFTFDAPTTMFGVVLTDLWDAAAGTNRQLDLSTNGGATVASILTSPTVLASGAEHFVGIHADNAFTELTLTTFMSVTDNIGLDEVRFNTFEQPETAPVPEPGSLALVASAGLVAAIAGRARRSRRARDIDAR